MKKVFIVFTLLLIGFLAYSQNTITGNFPPLKNQMVKLAGFEGFGNYIIDSVQSNENGVFTLSYSKPHYGMGYLMSEDGKTFIVLLAENEDLKLKGESFAAPQTIEILNGRQNQLFAQYASEHPRREQTLSAWEYLAKIYSKDSLFTIHEIPKQAIEEEKLRIKAEDNFFLASLGKGSYVSWYLPFRKMVSSVSIIAQFRTTEIPATIHAFREIDYTDKRLYKSGLLKETLEAHFWLIENSGRSLDSVYIEMNKSIDYMIENLLADEQKLNEITEYLFKLLEKRSLFQSSEYLAVKLLNEQNCTINSDFAAQLESYRVMKKGNIAPDIDFNGDVLASGYATNNTPQKLSDLNSKYTLIVFGAGWCPQCTKELTQLLGLYQKWKAQNVEVLFVSLDEDDKTFNDFASNFPFISICDYQKWESPAAKDYHVFATPTLYLIDSNRKIILRPNSVNQMDAWVDWFLVEGNHLY